MTGKTLVLLVAMVVAVVLLIFLGPLVDVILSRRKELPFRLMRAIMFLLVPAMVIVPSLAGVDENVGEGLIAVFYMAIFSFFCYAMGKRIGWIRGRKHISDLIGFDSPNAVEDAQDRLFESRLRYPLISDVIASIAKLAKVDEAKKLEKERRNAGRPDREQVEIVDVESVEPDSAKD